MVLSRASSRLLPIRSPGSSTTSLTEARFSTTVRYVTRKRSIFHFLQNWIIISS